jgi:hypothetical protein
MRNRETGLCLLIRGIRGGFICCYWPRIPQRSRTATKSETTDEHR